MRLTKLLAAALLAVVSLPALALAQTYKDEYRVSTVVPPPFPWGIAAERWVELVRERTEGRINMRVYPGAELVAGEQTRELAAMQRGIIDMAVGSTINWSPQIVELNIFSMPFLMPDYAALDALTHGPVGEKLFEIVRRKGVEPLAWAENGFRELTNARRPIRSPADLHGLTIRVVGSPLFNDIFHALGADPMQMSWADAQRALAAGAVDGQENPLTIYSILDMHEIGQAYVTLWHYVADPLIFAVNAEVYESFTPDDRSILRRAAEEAGALGIEKAREGLLGPDPALVRAIEEKGATVAHLTAEERQAFVDATRSVYDAWRGRIGDDLVTLAEEAVASRAAR